MKRFLDLDRFPLDSPDGVRGRALLARCRRDLRETGMFSLPRVIRPGALERCVAEVGPELRTAAFIHSREHNIYFEDDIEGLAADHPALARFETVNHTVCGDQIAASLVTRIYEWQPLIDFLAAAMDKPRLYPMADPLARINVMAYHAGEALNWHFDRSEFTTTCLLQAPAAGGEFQYRSGPQERRGPQFRGCRPAAGGGGRPGADPSARARARSTSSRAGTRPIASPRSKAIGRASSRCSPTTRRPTSRSVTRSGSASTDGQEAIQ